MAPGLPNLEAVRAVCAAAKKPFNFMVGIKGKSFTVAELAAAGSCEAHQPRDIPVSGGYDRIAERGRGGSHRAPSASATSTLLLLLPR